MVNKLIFCLGLLSITLSEKAIKVKFNIANMSVNIAEGSVGVFTAFELYPSTFIDVDSTNARELVDFETINYTDISEIAIGKTIV